MNVDVSFTTFTVRIGNGISMSPSIRQPTAKQHGFACGCRREFADLATLTFAHYQYKIRELDHVAMDLSCAMPIKIQSSGFRQFLG